MAYTLQAVKSNGGTISEAELLTFFENLEWFRTGPAYRLYDSDDGETVETTIGVMVWANGHYEWREGGGGDPNNGTYNTGTGGAYVNVGDVAGGVWVNGVMFAVRNVVSVVGGQDPRSLRVQLRRGDGSVWTELADFVNEDQNSGRRGAVHLSGLGTFSTSTDRVEVRAQVSTGSPPVVSHRQWGFRVGSTTDYTGDFAAARPVSDTNDELTAAWNQLRLNHARIERRPSAQRYKSGSTQATTANVAAAVTMASSDWASDTGMTTNVDRLDIQQSGIYLVTSQVTLDGMDAGGSFATATIQSITGADVQTVVSANAPEANNYDTVVSACDLVQIDAGRYVRTLITTGINATVQASRGTNITASLMSSNSGVSTGRQVFARMPHPDTWPDVANYSSAHLPAGTLRVLSDLTDRQWHRPAYKARSTEDVEVKMGGGWADVDVDEMVFDYTSLEATHGYRLLSGGALVLPWAGTWLVGARLSFSPTSVEGVNVGNVGIRGMRIALGERAAAGAFIGAAMNGASHGWTRTLMETVVVNREEGQEVRLQGLAAPNIGPASSLVAAAGSTITTIGAAATAITDLAETVDENDYEIPVTSAHLWAVELGEGITRVPR